MRVDMIVGNFRASWWPMWYGFHSYKMENTLITFLPEKVKGLTQDLVHNRFKNTVGIIFKQQQQHTTSIASASSCSRDFKAQRKFTQDNPSECWGGPPGSQTRSDGQHWLSTGSTITGYDNNNNLFLLIACEPQCTWASYRMGTQAVLPPSQPLTTVHPVCLLLHCGVRRGAQ